MQGLKIFRLQRPQSQLLINQIRHFSLSHALAKKFTTFDDAVDNSTSAPSSPGNDVKLKMYALYKQATVGKVNTKKPGMLDLVGKAKWEAWNSIGNISQEEAKTQYIDIVNSLFDKPQQESSQEDGDGFSIKIENGIKTITLTRPTKKNALTNKMYVALTDALNSGSADPNTNIIVLTGTGDYFCSGNDLGNFSNVTDVKAMAEAGRKILQLYIGAYIDCKKPLIALLNGPAVGIGVTILGLCDIVYASDKATMTTPFSALGQSPEGCSSYIFPRVMGYAKASELLFFNSKITAKEGEACGLITKVFPDDKLQTEAWQRINAMAKLPVKSLVYSKDLVRGRERSKLHEVNLAECDRLLERWQSEDCMNAIMSFFSKKSK